MRVTIVLHGLYYVLDNISSQSFLLYIFWWLYNGYQSSLEFVSLITNEAEHFFSNFIDFLDSLFSEDRSALVQNPIHCLTPSLACSHSGFLADVKSSW